MDIGHGFYWLLLALLPLPGFSWLLLHQKHLSKLMHEIRAHGPFKTSEKKGSPWNQLGKQDMPPIDAQARLIE
jgi:hypothetical protein